MSPIENFIFRLLSGFSLYGKTFSHKIARKILTTLKYVYTTLSLDLSFLHVKCTHTYIAMDGMSLKMQEQKGKLSYAQ